MNLFGRHRTGCGSPARGAVLVIVLIVVLLTALAAYGFAFFMRSEYRATKTFHEQQQARATALSGIAWLMTTIEQPIQERQRQMDVELPIVLERQLENDASLDDWRFVVVRGRQSDDVMPGDEIRSLTGGVINESSKLNLLSLRDWDREYPGHAAEALRNLPGMDDESLARLMKLLAIEDEFDSDSSTSGEDSRVIESPGGRRFADTDRSFDSDVQATAQESVAVDPGTLANLRAFLDDPQDLDANGKLDPLELFADNREGQIQQNIDVAMPSSESRRRPGLSNVGQDGSKWRDFVTLDSAERNESMQGLRRINLNQDDLAKLHADLQSAGSAAWANFVVLYRQHGPNQGSGSLTDPAQTGVDFNSPPRVEIASLFDLIDAKVMISGPDETSQLVRSPWSSESPQLAESFGKLYDRTTTIDSERLVGRINLRLAMPAVLRSIPTMDEARAREVVNLRSTQSSGENVSILVRLMTAREWSLEQIKQIEPFVTDRGDVWQTEVIGYRDEASALHRIQAVIDGSRPSAQLVRCRELQHLGRGYTIAELDSADSAMNETKP